MFSKWNRVKNSFPYLIANCRTGLISTTLCNRSQTTPCTESRLLWMMNGFCMMHMYVLVVLMKLFMAIWISFMLGFLFAFLPVVLLMVSHFNGILVNWMWITTLKFIIFKCIFFCQTNNRSIVWWDDNFWMSARFTNVYWSEVICRYFEEWEKKQWIIHQYWELTLNLQKKA